MELFLFLDLLDSLIFFLFLILHRSLPVCLLLLFFFTMSVDGRRASLLIAFSSFFFFSSFCVAYRANGTTTFAGHCLFNVYEQQQQHGVFFFSPFAFSWKNVNRLFHPTFFFLEGRRRTHKHALMLHYLSCCLFFFPPPPSSLLCLALLHPSSSFLLESRPTNVLNVKRKQQYSLERK